MLYHSNGVNLVMMVRETVQCAAHSTIIVCLLDRMVDCLSDGRMRGKGEGVERFTLLLNIVDQPARLKSVVLSFMLLEAHRPSELRLKSAATTKTPRSEGAHSVPGLPHSPTADLIKERESLVLDRGPDHGAMQDPCQAKQQGKKRFRLRHGIHSSFDGTPHFARNPEGALASHGVSIMPASTAILASPVPVPTAVAAAAVFLGGDLSVSVRTDELFSEASPIGVGGCLPVASCAGTTRGEHFR